MITPDGTGTPATKGGIPNVPVVSQPSPVPQPTSQPTTDVETRMTRLEAAESRSAYNIPTTVYKPTPTYQPPSDLSREQRAETQQIRQQQAEARRGYVPQTTTQQPTQETTQQIQQTEKETRAEQRITRLEQAEARQQYFMQQQGVSGPTKAQQIWEQKISDIISNKPQVTTTPTSQSRLARLEQAETRLEAITARGQYTRTQGGVTPQTGGGGGGGGGGETPTHLDYPDYHASFVIQTSSGPIYFSDYNQWQQAKADYASGKPITYYVVNGIKYGDLQSAQLAAENNYLKNNLYKMGSQYYFDSPDGKIFFSSKSAAEAFIWNYVVGNAKYYTIGDLKLGDEGAVKQYLSNSVQKVGDFYQLKLPDGTTLNFSSKSAADQFISDYLSGNAKYYNMAGKLYGDEDAYKQAAIEYYTSLIGYSSGTEAESKSAYLFGLGKFGRGERLFAEFEFATKPYTAGKYYLDTPDGRIYFSSKAEAVEGAKKYVEGKLQYQVVNGIKFGDSTAAEQAIKQYLSTQISETPVQKVTVAPKTQYSGRNIDIYATEIQKAKEVVGKYAVNLGGTTYYFATQEDAQKAIEQYSNYVAGKGEAPQWYKAPNSNITFTSLSSMQNYLESQIQKSGNDYILNLFGQPLKFTSKEQAKEYIDLVLHGPPKPEGKLTDAKLTALQERYGVYNVGGYTVIGLSNAEKLIQQQPQLVSETSSITYKITIGGKEMTFNSPQEAAQYLNGKYLIVDSSGQIVEVFSSKPTQEQLAQYGIYTNETPEGTLALLQQTANNILQTFSFGLGKSSSSVIGLPTSSQPQPATPSSYQLITPDRVTWQVQGETLTPIFSPETPTPFGVNYLPWLEQYSLTFAPSRSNALEFPIGKALGLFLTGVWRTPEMFFTASQWLSEASTRFAIQAERATPQNAWDFRNLPQSFQALVLHAEGLLSAIGGSAAAFAGGLTSVLNPEAIATAKIPSAYLIPATAGVAVNLYAMGGISDIINGIKTSRLASEILDVSQAVRKGISLRPFEYSTPKEMTILDAFNVKATQMAERGLPLKRLELWTPKAAEESKIGKTITFWKGEVPIEKVSGRVYTSELWSFPWKFPVAENIPAHIYKATELSNILKGAPSYLAFGTERVADVSQSFLEAFNIKATQMGRFVGGQFARTIGGAGVSVEKGIFSGISIPKTIFGVSTASLRDVLTGGGLAIGLNFALSGGRLPSSYQEALSEFEMGGAFVTGFMPIGRALGALGRAGRVLAGPVFGGANVGISMLQGETRPEALARSFWLGYGLAYSHLIARGIIGGGKLFVRGFNALRAEFGPLPREPVDWSKYRRMAPTEEQRVFELQKQGMLTSGLSREEFERFNEELASRGMESMKLGYGKEWWKAPESETLYKRMADFISNVNRQEYGAGWKAFREEGRPIKPATDNVVKEMIEANKGFGWKTPQEIVERFMLNEFNIRATQRPPKFMLPRETKTPLDNFVDAIKRMNQRIVGSEMERLERIFGRERRLPTYEEKVFELRKRGLMESGMSREEVEKLYEELASRTAESIKLGYGREWWKIPDILKGEKPKVSLEEFNKAVKEMSEKIVERAKRFKYREFEEPKPEGKLVGSREGTVTIVKQEEVAKTKQEEEMKPKEEIKPITKEEKEEGKSLTEQERIYRELARLRRRGNVWYEYQYMRYPPESLRRDKTLSILIVDEFKDANEERFEHIPTLRFEESFGERFTRIPESRFEQRFEERFTPSYRPESQVEERFRLIPSYRFELIPRLTFEERFQFVPLYRFTPLEIQTPQQIQTPQTTLIPITTQTPREEEILVPQTITMQVTSQLRRQKTPPPEYPQSTGYPTSKRPQSVAGEIGYRYGLLIHRISENIMADFGTLVSNINNSVGRGWLFRDPGTVWMRRGFGYGGSVSFRNHFRVGNKIQFGRGLVHADVRRLMRGNFITRPPHTMRAQFGKRPKPPMRKIFAASQKVISDIVNSVGG